MKTALQKIMSAIQLEKENPDIYMIDGFSFRYQNCKFEYHGPYYGYLMEDGQHEEWEYCWAGYDEMLNSKIHQAGMTMRQLLSELTEQDIQIDFALTGKPTEL